MFIFIYDMNKFELSYKNKNKKHSALFYQPNNPPNNPTEFL